MKKYIYTIVHSSIDPQFYIQIARASFTKAILYILSLILIIGLITGTAQGIASRGYVLDVLDIIESDIMPDFTIKDGLFTMDSSEPLIFDFDQQFIIIIDASDTMSINDLAGYSIGYLLQSQTLTISNAGTTPIYRDLNAFTNMGFEMDKTTLIETIQLTSKLVVFFSIILQPIIIFFSILFKSFFIFLMSLVMKNLNKYNNISTSEHYKMIIHSMTLGLIITQLLDLAYLVLPSSVAIVNVMSVLSILLFYFPTFYILYQGMKVYSQTKATKIDLSL